MKWCTLLAVAALCPAMAALAGEDRNPAPQANRARVVKSGDTLRSIAQQTYGNPCYSALLAIHNGIEDEGKLRPKQEIKTPDLKTLLTKEGLATIVGQEMTAMLRARTLFMDVEGPLRELREGKPERRVEIPPNVKTALTSAAESIDAAIVGLKRKKEGIGATPQKMIEQLTSVSQNLKELAAGSNDGYGYDVDMVHQRLVHAMLNGIKWARNGYK